MALNTKRGQPPTLLKVLDVIGANFPSWYVLGVHMEMDDRDLDTIQANERDVRKQCTVMVQTWLRNSEKPEWGVLYKALRKIGEHALAEQVSTQYCCEITESETLIAVQTPTSNEPSSHRVQVQGDPAAPDDPPPCSPPIQEREAASHTPSQCIAPIPACNPDVNLEKLSESRKWKLSAYFSHMFVMVVQLLEKVNVSILKFFLADLHHATTRQPYVDPKCFEKCKSTAQVLRSLSPQYINVTHPYLLQEIVERFGCDRSKALVEEYLTRFDQEARSLSLKQFGDPLSNNDIEACHGVRTIKVVMDGDPDSVTLSEVEMCRKVLESTMSVKHAVIVFAKHTTENSVGLIFLVPDSLLGVIVDMSKDKQNLKELASCEILRIESEACTIVLTEDPEYWKLRFLKRTFGKQSKEWDADSGFTSMSSSRTSSLGDISVVGDASTKDDQMAYEFAEKLHANTTDSIANFTLAIISDVAAAQLADGLSDNHSLKRLNLRYCRISVEGVSHLASALQTNKSLMSLWLWDTQLSDEGVDELAKSLNVNETLQRLYLWDCKVSDRGAASLAVYLYDNRSLKILNLRWNKITDRGATCLGEALSVNNTLTVLYLSSNDITDGGALALATSLHTNHSIKTLDLNGNKLTDTGVCAVAHAVQDSQTLEKLWLSLRMATDRGAGVLADSLEATSSLKWLGLSGTSHISRGVMERMEGIARKKGIKLNLYQ